MSKYTPGPWRLINGLIRCPEGSCVLDADDANMREADAVLVTAAPELLEAIRFFMDMVGEPPESNCSCHIAPPCNDCVEHIGLREAFDVARAAIAKATGKQA